LDIVASIVEEIKSTNSRNAKEAILVKYKDVHAFRNVMHFIYNPYQHTGISDKKMKAYKSDISGLCLLEDAINYFSCHTTGAECDVTFAWYFVNSQETKRAKALAYAMVTKNLKIGLTETTLNKVYGANFIPVIGCALGVEYGKIKSKMAGIYIASRKIDGIRRLLVKENGYITMYSRSGIPDEGLVDIIREASYLPDNVVYDGELEAIGDFQNNIALRQATSSIANSNGHRTGLTFNIFDMIPVDEFKLGESLHIALVRKRAIELMFGFATMEDIEPLRHLSMMKYIKAVPIECVSDNLALHEKVFHRMVAAGEEGLMLIKAASKYKVGKRTNDWVKMKNYLSIQLKVVDLFEGTGKYKNMLGGVLVDYQGQLVGVGSGFNDFEREHFWQKPHNILTKTIDIVCQGESVDSTTGNVSLNCAIYKGVTDQEKELGAFIKLMEA